MSTSSSSPSCACALVAAPATAASLSLAGATVAETSLAGSVGDTIRGAGLPVMACSVFSVRRRKYKT